MEICLEFSKSCELLQNFSFVKLLPILSLKSLITSRKQCCQFSKLAHKKNLSNINPTKYRKGLRKLLSTKNGLLSLCKFGLQCSQIISFSQRSKRLSDFKALLCDKMQQKKLFKLDYFFAFHLDTNNISHILEN